MLDKLKDAKARFGPACDVNDGSSRSIVRIRLKTQIDESGGPTATPL